VGLVHSVEDLNRKKTKSEFCQWTAFRFAWQLSVSSLSAGFELVSHDNSPCQLLQKSHFSGGLLLIKRERESVE
jgi:hypothetical protein